MKAFNAAKLLPKNEGQPQDEEPELPQAEDDRVKFTFYIEKDVHKRLRRYTSDHDLSLQAFLEEITHGAMINKGMEGWPSDKRNLRKKRKTKRG